MTAAPRVIRLREFKEKPLPANAISLAFAERVWAAHRSHLDLEPPSGRNGHVWILRPTGYVGILPITHDVTVAIEPKVPIRSVFRMMEYAFDLDSFRTEDVVGAATIGEMYESLARVLAARVERRIRRGLQRRYIERTERLGFVRGRIETQRLHRVRFDPTLSCTYEEHTVDHVDNQILLYTLSFILRRLPLGEEAKRPIAAVVRGLRDAISWRAFTGGDCRNRTYDRLNEDYRQMHALCAFFLDQAGATHESGEQQMLPFLIKMHDLFEKFVARWLRTQLPEEFELVEQYSGSFDEEGRVAYRMDLVIRDALGRPLQVLDTKYKNSTTPSAPDLHQILAYAAALGCKQGLLIYPHPLTDALEVSVGGIWIITVGTPLMEDQYLAAAPSWTPSLIYHLPSESATSHGPAGIG